MAHAPFTCHVPYYEAGTLQVTGFIDGKSVIINTATTPGKPYKIIVKADYSGKPFKAGYKDAVFVYAYIVDSKGTIIPDATNSVRFSVNGDANIVGDKINKAESGIAPALIMGGAKAGNIIIKANADGLMSGELSVLLK